MFPHNKACIFPLYEERNFWWPLDSSLYERDMVHLILHFETFKSNIFNWANYLK